MKNIFLFLLLLSSLTLNAQKDWIEKIKSTYTVHHPATWKEYASENTNELTLAGPSPDFEGKTGYLGTTLFIETSKSKYNSMDSVSQAYKEKIKSVEVLEKVKFKKEKKFKFNGVEAVEIVFSAKVQGYNSLCRMFLFQHNNVYYEVSVTSDPRLKKDLLNEAYQVMESFTFIEK